MKISIITVCFNAKDTIEETFLSIFNQTYKDVELIVIDGVSTDGTLEVINKYREKIAYFLSEPDSGIYDAMNKGIKASSGDFMLFLNANDLFYDENVLQNVAKALIENPDAKMLFGDVDYVSEDKKTSSIFTFNMIKNDFALIFNNICHQCIFYSKSLFEEFGLYSEEFKIYADWDFNIKCLMQNKAPAIYLPIVISKFQLGGLCSNDEYKKACAIEKKALVNKYYKKHKLLILTNGVPHIKLRATCRQLKRLFISPIANPYMSQRKYLLNIKKSLDLKILYQPKKR